MKIVSGGQTGVDRAALDAALERGVEAGGTEQTIAHCIKEQEPYLLIDAEELSIERAARNLEHFIDEHSIFVLNVAGLRASGEPRAYSFARDVIQIVLGE